MKRTSLLLLSAFVAVVLIALMVGKVPKVEYTIRKNIYGNNPLTGKYYSINGFRMYCEVYGTGKPVLMIHGNGGHVASFTRQIPFFSKHFQVIIADSRAQGKSIDTSDSLTYEQMADDYAALLTAMHIESANLLGWSDGGIIGLLLAMRHPEKVKKLAVTGANLWPDSTAVDSGILAEIMPRYLELKNLFAQAGAKPADDSTDFKLTKLLIEQPHIPLSDLAKINAPTFVIAGDHDLILPAHTLQIFQHLPNAYLWIVPHCGHSTLIDYADDFNKKTAAFFRDPYKRAEKKDNEF